VIGGSRVRSPNALGGHQHSAEGHLYIQLLLAVLQRVWKGLEQLQPLAEVPDRFHMRRALLRALARLIPVPHRLLGAARLGIMLRQQLGVRRDRLRELRL
jgi:hypothetical protein